MGDAPGSSIEAISSGDDKERCRRVYDLDELVSRIAEDNTHREVDTGSAHGNEQWGSGAALGTSV